MHGNIGRLVQLVKNAKIFVASVEMIHRRLQSAEFFFYEACLPQLVNKQYARLHLLFHHDITTSRRIFWVMMQLV